MIEYIYGKNPVKEIINAQKPIYKMYVLESNNEFISLAKKNNITYEIVDNNVLNGLVQGAHQGVVIETGNYHYYSLDEIVNSKTAEQKYPLIIVLDGLEDPHNLGAILRICDSADVNGVLIGKNRSVRLNNTVAKVSTGAIEYVKVCEVTNIVSTLKELKKIGYWMVGAEITNNSVDYNKLKYDMPTVLIIGSEGKGISRLVLEQCDFVVKIPMYGHVNSLNASVSCGIITYEINKYRKE